MTSLIIGRFNLVDCLHDYRNAITIHGDDVLAHGNWEISEGWFARFGCVFLHTTSLHHHIS